MICSAIYNVVYKIHSMVCSTIYNTHSVLVYSLVTRPRDGANADLPPRRTRTGDGELMRGRNLQLLGKAVALPAHVNTIVLIRVGAIFGGKGFQKTSLLVLIRHWRLKFEKSTGEMRKMRIPS